MEYFLAAEQDIPVLAEMNHQLIEDEGHRNAMTPEELADRMRGWLLGPYRAILFHEPEHTGAVAYALYASTPEEIYLRHFFVARHCRRRGLGRQAIQILLSKIWPQNSRLVVDVLSANTAAVDFWRAMGFQDYSLKLEIMPGQR